MPYCVCFSDQENSLTEEIFQPKDKSQHTCMEELFLQALIYYKSKNKKEYRHIIAGFSMSKACSYLWYCIIPKESILKG